MTPEQREELGRMVFKEMNSQGGFCATEYLWPQLDARVKGLWMNAAEAVWNKAAEQFATATTPAAPTQEGDRE